MRRRLGRRSRLPSNAIDKSSTGALPPKRPGDVRVVTGAPSRPQEEYRYNARPTTSATAPDHRHAVDMGATDTELRRDPRKRSSTVPSNRIRTHGDGARGRPVRRIRWSSDLFRRVDVRTGSDCAK